MTEAEWLACVKRSPMFRKLERNASDRKLRLFASSCLQRVEHLIPMRLRHASIEVPFKYADANATDQEMDQVGTDAYYCGVEGEGEREGYVDSNYLACKAIEQLTGHQDNAWEPVYGVCEYALDAVGGGVSVGDEAEEIQQCELLRDIFGNPFRPVTCDPTWRTSTVTALAQQMYDSRDFTAMPILADALQDAGCENADILTHCRGPGPHVRGCWVLDLVLGRS